MIDSRKCVDNYETQKTERSRPIKMLLRIDRMQVKYQDQIALQITEPILIAEGDNLGVIGSNGAGKSTLIRSLVGLKKYEGHVKTQLKPSDMAVQMQFNNYPEGVNCRVIMERIIGMRIKEHQEAQELIRYFDFEECLGKKYSKLSGGQKQRFTVILVMLQEAPITFYDEVTSGLDFETRNALMSKLDEWYASRDDVLVIVSHYYEELERLAKKLLILDKGRVVAFGEKRQLFQKYCGRCVIVLENNEKNKTLVESENRIASPAQSLAISPRTETEELALVEKLVRENVNFRRSECDIELLYINAKRKEMSEENENGR